jgi:hypothetical protein
LQASLDATSVIARFDREWREVGNRYFPILNARLNRYQAEKRD